MKPKRLLLILSISTLAAVLSALALRHTQPAPKLMPASTRTFQVHGKIRGLDLSNKTIRLAHEEIPGYMPAMTMPLVCKDAVLLRGLSVGDNVQFELTVNLNDSWISHIEKISPENPAKAPSAGDSAPGQNSEAASNELQKGELVPDFSLVDQNGQPLRLSDFRGKAVVITFIYTRCPLPNFCPLMSKNFAALQDRLTRAFPGRYQLLSISIDAKFDRPEVLKQYAARYNADEEVWRFATGEQEQINFVAGLFGLVHESENGLISHSLRTALIGADGRLVHLWKSNVWTPYEVHRMIGDTFHELGAYSAVR